MATTTPALSSRRPEALAAETALMRGQASAGMLAVAARRLRRDYLTLGAALLLVAYGGLALGADVL